MFYSVGLDLRVQVFEVKLVRDLRLNLSDTIILIYRSTIFAIRPTGRLTSRQYKAIYSIGIRTVAHRLVIPRERLFG